VFTVLPYENGTNIRNAERDEGHPGEGRGKSRCHAAKLEAWQEKADADMKAWGEEIHSIRFETTNTRTETMAYQDMEAHPEEEKEPTSVYRKPEVAQKQEVPVEDAEVMPVGEPKKKRRRDRKLDAECRRQEPKNTKRINGGPPGEIGRRPQRDEPPRNSGTAK
jgi:hypothetical protein